MKLFLGEMRCTYKSKFLGDFKTSIGLMKSFERICMRNMGGFGVECCIGEMICIVLHCMYVEKGNNNRIREINKVLSQGISGYLSHLVLRNFFFLSLLWNVL